MLTVNDQRCIIKRNLTHEHNRNKNTENKDRVLWMLSLSLSPFVGHCPGGPGLASTRMSPFLILLQIMVTEVVVTIGAMNE